MKIALIGFGAWGKNWARNLAKLGALQAICDEDPSRLLEARETYPHVSVFDSSEKLLKQSDLQAVVIAAPPAMHFSLAVQALRSGKDVLVEKPLALQVSEGEAMVEEAKRLNRVLMVGHVLEFHPAIVKLRELIEQGSIGKIQYAYSHRLNFGQIRVEENALWSFAPHDIALLLGFMKRLPEVVRCDGRAFLNGKTADTTVTTLDFESGVQAHIFVSWLHPFKVHRLVVIGERQMAVFDDTHAWSKKLVLYPHHIRWAEGQVPLATREEGMAVPLEEVEPLEEECRHFIQCVSQRKKPVTSGEEGVKVLRVLEAAEEAMRNGGKVSLADHKTVDFYVHPTAVVDAGASIGKGTKIWHFSHVMPDARIGANCILGQNTFVGRNVVIGDGVKIQNNVSVYEGVTLEDFVFCGPSVTFTNVKNPRSKIERKNEFMPTRVRRGATLGAHSTIICGVTIGRYAFVGSSALVTKDVPDYALVIGVPGRIVGSMCECGVQLRFCKGKAICQTCKKTYRYSKGQGVVRVA